ncbi:hypothetical protein GCM10029963_77330 [Micromonospora andamanensis]|uniref:hypothetical protein n=1 Tax=Micromonospora andamanensis TaxID=1287068 RepID=UPI00194DD96A|nr:hypothetical protein [Micromonospora andamanensis]GIJ40270.1 hypothetical protein Vwe01_35950 [Micromonospora andamanensis]
MRIGIVLLLAGASTLFAPDGATAETSAQGPLPFCQVERLQEIDKNWEMSIVTAADTSGRYIAGRGYPEDSGYRRVPVVWDRGEPTAVDIPGIDQSIRDMNAAGVAVASSYDEQTWEPLTPWIIRDGRLGALPGVASGTANGINERGDVVGETADRQPVKWPAIGTGNGVAVLLPMPKGATWAQAHDIDEDGTIVGFHGDVDGAERAHVWTPDGEIAVLPPLPGAAEQSAAFTIRGGWITGRALSEDGTWQQARWRLTDEPQTFPRFDYLAGANASGWLVGSAFEQRALLWAGSRYVELPGLAALGEYGSDLATEISDNGRTIAGYATDEEEALRAVRWTCS